MDTTTATLRWPVPYKPADASEDTRQRDAAAEWARRQGWSVVSINRGPRNLVLRVVR